LKASCQLPVRCQRIAHCTVFGTPALSATTRTPLQSRIEQHNPDVRLLISSWSDSRNELSAVPRPSKLLSRCAIRESLRRISSGSDRGRSTVKHATTPYTRDVVQVPFRNAFPLFDIILSFVRSAALNGRSVVNSAIAQPTPFGMHALTSSRSLDCSVNDSDIISMYSAKVKSKLVAYSTTATCKQSQRCPITVDPLITSFEIVLKPRSLPKGVRCQF
jgi:hypothetical protein